MAEGLDAASFEFYEGIRILVPGALTLGIVEGGARTLGTGNEGLGVSAFEAVGLSLLIGLLFYFADVPAKAAIFSPDQPTDTLDAWQLKPKQGGTLNTYFVILDTVMPAAIRARSLYMGSMFRIGMETIFILGFGAAVLISSHAWSFSVVDFDADKGDRSVYVAAALTWCIWAFAVWREWKIRRNNPAAAERRRGQVVDFSWLDLALLVPPTVFISVALTGKGEPHAWLLVAPVLWVFALWAIRYFRGYPAASVKGARRPINAPHACLLLGYAQLCALATTFCLPEHPAHVSGSERNVWLVVQLLALVLVCSRGHEKRLRGAYSTQNTWLKLNREALSGQFFAAPRSEEPSEAAGSNLTGSTGSALMPTKKQVLILGLLAGMIHIARNRWKGAG